MSAVETGVVRNVWEQRYGSRLAVDHVNGATVLTVQDAADFRAVGGILTVTNAAGITTQYTYVAVDFDADTITLDPLGSGLVGGYDESDWVGTYPVRSDWKAQVMLGGEGDEDSSITAKIAHHLIGYLPEGQRDPDAGEAVFVDERGPGDWWLFDLIGQSPVLQGSQVTVTDPAALVSDGVPPSASVAPVCVPGIGNVQFRGYDIVNNDPVAYNLYLSTSSGFTPGAGTLVAMTGDTVKTITKMADGTPIPYQTDLFAKVIATDADGAAPASAETGPFQLIEISGPDIGANTIAGLNIIGQTITGDKLSATFILASDFVTGLQGQRGVFNNSGLTFYDSAGNVMVALSAGYDPDNPTAVIPHQFKGVIEADSLTVKGKLTIRGLDNSVAMGAAVQLDAGVQASTDTVAHAIDWETYPIASPNWTFETVLSWARATVDGQEACLTGVWNGIGHLRVLKAGVWEDWPLSSANGFGTAGAYAVGLVAHHSGQGWVLVVRDKALADAGGGSVWTPYKGYHVKIDRTGTPFVQVVASASLSTQLINLASSDPWKTVRVGMSYSATHRFWVSWADTSGANARKPRIWGLNMPGKTGETAWARVITEELAALPSGQDMQSVGPVFFGGFDGIQSGGVSNGVYYSCNNGTFYCWDNTSGNPRITDTEFPMSNQVDGFVWAAYQQTGGTGAESSITYAYEAFRQIAATTGSTGVIHTNGGNAWTATNDKYWWAAAAYFNDGNGKHTPIGPKKLITMTKRARLTLTSPAIPAGDPSDPGYNAADWPDSVRFYVGKNTATTPPATTAMFRQTDPVVTDLTVRITNRDISGGTASSEASTNTFPLGLGGVIKSGALRLDSTPKFLAAGNGSGNFDGLLPPGTVAMFANANIPTGWLPCDGASLSTTLYPDLFAAIGYLFGGSGASFNAPDFRRRVPLGYSGVTSTLSIGANDGGAISGGRTWTHSHTIGGQTGDASAVKSGSGTVDVPRNAHYDGHAHGGDTGTHQAPYLGINFMIKT